MALQSMTALASITLQEATASVWFSGIPQNYRDLVVAVHGTINTGGGEVVQVAFNLDTTAGNYPVVFADGNGATASSGSDTTNRRFGLIYPTRTNFINNIMDYSATNKHKTFLTRINGPSNVVSMNAGRWSNTAGITSIAITTAANSFTTGSTFDLYGRIG